MYAPKLITPPLASPVTLAQVKAHVRRTSSADDETFLTLITEAVTEAEHQTRRALLETEYDYFANAWCSTFVLPRGNLISVASVNYTDKDGTELTAASSLYWVDTNTIPGRVYLRSGSSWPVPSGGLRAVNPIRIRYSVGYAALTTGAITTATNTSANRILTTAPHGYTRPVLIVDTGLEKRFEFARVGGASELVPIAEWPDMATGRTLDVYDVSAIPFELIGAILKRIHDLDRYRGDDQLEQGITSLQSQQRIRAIYRRYGLV